ncbi:hypothetical protein AMTRI_Chr06g196650 [Amborella trichopoda]
MRNFLRFVDLLENFILITITLWAKAYEDSKDFFCEDFHANFGLLLMTKRYKIRKAIVWKLHQHDGLNLILIVALEIMG